MSRLAVKRRRNGGNMAMETMIFLPIMFMLIVGMLRLAEITYLYYTLKKALYTMAQFLANQQGVDFCGDATGLIAAAKNLGLTNTTDGSADSFLPTLTIDQINISPECYDPTTQTVGLCDTSGCGTAAGVVQPDYIVVSIPDGYGVNPRLPYILNDTIPLKPFVRVPFGGT
jgi:Flp pilus assembly protein TadG